MQTTINANAYPTLPPFVNMTVSPQGSNVPFSSSPVITGWPITGMAPNTVNADFFAPAPASTFNPAMFPGLVTLPQPPASSAAINGGALMPVLPGTIPDIPIWNPPMPPQAQPMTAPLTTGAASLSGAPIPFKAETGFAPGAPTTNYRLASPAPIARPANTLSQPLLPTTPYNWNGASKTLPYSEAVKLIEAGQVQHAAIVMDSHSFTAIPTAELQFVNGATVKMLLPRDMQPFTTMLEENNVAYEYRNNAPTGGAKIGKDLLGIAKEMFVPFIMLGAAGASAAFAMKRFQQKQADGETAEAIRKAKKDLTTYKFDFNTILKDHEEPVQRALGQFVREEKQVVIAKGLPGIGKTHVFLALAKEIQKQDPDTFVLEIRPGVGDNVRDLLKEMYSGDRTLALKAMKFLQEENGGKPVKDLLLYADEVEKIPGNLMEFLINNGIGNPAVTVPGLPKLRILATCNAWPNFINNSATLSRSTAVIITPPTPRIVSKIFAENLAEETGGKVDAEKLTEKMRGIFSEYDGYSPRTIAQSVSKQVANTLKEDNDFSDKHVEDVLRATLDRTPLNDTEVASLLTRLMIKSVMSGQQPLDAINGPTNMWKSLLDDAESATKGLLFLVESNGKQYKRTIEALLKRTDLDYVKDPQAFNRAVTSITDALKTERLAGLTFKDAQLTSEKELTNLYVDFLERCVEKEKATPDPQGRGHSAKTVKALESVVQQLRHVDRKSEAGQALSQAAVIYQRLRDVADTASPVFLDSDKLDAVFTRTLDYDPAVHNAKNDFVLVSDPDYAALFKLLSRVLRLSLPE